MVRTRAMGDRSLRGESGPQRPRAILRPEVIAGTRTLAASLGIGGSIRRRLRLWKPSRLLSPATGRSQRSSPPRRSHLGISAARPGCSEVMATSGVSRPQQPSTSYCQGPAEERLGRGIVTPHLVQHGEVVEVDGDLVVLRAQATLEERSGHSGGVGSASSYRPCPASRAASAATSAATCKWSGPSAPSRMATERRA